MKFFPIAALLCLTLLSSVSRAEELNYHLVQLQAEAETTLENDLMTVILTASAEADAARDAAATVNRAMRWALGQVESLQWLKSRTLSYQTHPRYRNGTVTGWHASQQLQLESDRVEQLAGLAGQLQERLQISSMNFSVSPAARQQAMDHLTAAAITAFGEKARLVVETIGAVDYRLVSLSLGDNLPAPRYDRSFQAEAIALSEAAAPGVQAGESRLAVRVTGTIQLSY